MKTEQPSLSRTVIALAVAIALCHLSLARAETEPVRVVNFPDVQSVSGTVEIDKPVPGTRLARISEDVVAPADPTDAINLIAAGTLDGSGFRSAVLSLAGQIKSNYPGSGAVGAILVPDTAFILRAFEEDGKALLAIRLEAAVDSDNGTYFAVTLPQQDLAFPSYKVYFFNTTERPAGVHLYAYLAN